MSLDATVTRLKKVGIVTIFPEPDAVNGIQITITGFEGEQASCRDVSVLATIWAIGVLQRSLMAEVEAPGGGTTGIE